MRKYRFKAELKVELTETPATKETEGVVVEDNYISAIRVAQGLVADEFDTVLELPYDFRTIEENGFVVGLEVTTEVETEEFEGFIEYTIKAER